MPDALNGGKRRNGAGSAAGNGAEVEEWLPSEGIAAPRGGKASRNRKQSRSGSAARSAEPSGQPESRAPRRRHKLPKRASPRERWLIFRLRRSRRREEELRAQIDLLQARITELEAEARAAGRNGGSPKVSPANGNGARPQRKAAPRRRTSTAPAASKARKQTAAQAKRARSSRETARRRPAKATARRNGRSARNGNGKLDLNAATFDQLRGLGLSITQTSRLISHRETAGGFGQLDELAEIKGLSRATIAELRSRVRV